MDLHFVVSSNATQKGCHLPQKAVTDVQTVMLMLFHNLLWTPHYANFMEVASLVGDFIGRTMPNQQLFCHFIDSHSRH
jgi:hypothetical protein